MDNGRSEFLATEQPHPPPLTPRPHTHEKTNYYRLDYCWCNFAVSVIFRPVRLLI